MCTTSAENTAAEFKARQNGRRKSDAQMFLADYISNMQDDDLTHKAKFTSTVLESIDVAYEVPISSTPAEVENYAYKRCLVLNNLE
jgi:hypothetical protein